MPCSDSSSGLNIHLDSQERLISFEFAKVTCSSEISAQTGLSLFCKLKSLQEILELDFQMLVSVLELNDSQERQFIMFLELQALKSGIAQYLGINNVDYDPDRCQVSSIEYDQDRIEISMIILPPKELPKITACSKSIPSL